MAKNRQIKATLVLSEGNFFTNIKRASSGLNSLKKNFDNNSSSMKKHASVLDSTGSSLTSLAKKAVAAVSAYAGISKIVSFGKDAIKTGMDFEQGMAQVQAISGATGADFIALRDKAKEMGATTKFTAIESAEAMKYMGMAGWNSSQMIDGIAGIMNLAAASGEELGSVSDIVTDSLTAFGLKASDSARFADVLAMAATKSNTNVSMLGESFKYVAPVAGAMGYTFQDTTTALGLMANSGIKASEAGTALRSVMTRLAKPTKEVYAAFDALNLQATNSDGSMKSLSVLVPELQKKFSGLTAEEKGRYATMLAGKNAMSGLLALVNASTDDWNSLSAAIANSDGTAQSMANTMNDTVSGKLTLFQSQLEGVKISMFDSLGNSKFKDAIGMAGDLLTDLTPTLNNIATWLGDKMATGIEKTGQAISWVKDNWSWLAPVIGGVVGAIVAYKTAVSVATGVQWAMNAAMSANPIGIIIVGIAALIGGLVALYKNCEGFRNAVNTAFGTISTAAKYVWEQIKIVWSAVSPFFTKIWEGIKVAVSVLKVYLIGMFKTAWETIKFCWGNVINFFKTIWETIKGIFSVVKSVLSGDWQGAWDAIKGIVGMWGGFFSGVWEGIKNVFGSVGDWFGSVFTSAWEMVKNAFSNVVGFFQGIWDTIKNMFTSIGTTIADGISGAFKSVINAVIKFAGGLINNFIRGINWAIDKINTIPGVNISKLTEISLPMLAKGGIIRRGGDVIVGERGPEMLSLPRGAQVTPLPAGATSGGNTYTNTFYVTVNADDGSAAAKFVRQVKEILDNM